MAGLTVNPYVRGTDLHDHVRKLTDAVRQVIEGKNNATGTFTLTPSATTTVVKAPSCTPDSEVFITPQTADAANDMATTSIIAGNGQFTVTHANNARSDRTFGFVVLG